MTLTDDRPTSVLDRSTVPPRRTAPDPHSAREPTAVPLGWGSHAERRLVRQVLVFFALLGLYAVAFVLVGAVVWT